MLLLRQKSLHISKESFRKNIKANYDKRRQIRDEKLQYDFSKEAVKILALSTGKNDKYEYLTAEEILPINHRAVIEEPKFTYSPLEKALEKETKTIEDQIKKQIKATEEHEKQLVKSNAFSEKEKNIPLDRQKKYSLIL